MKIADEINLANLFSLYKLISLKNDSTILDERKNFSAIASTNSIWPNAIFKIDNAKLTDEIIDEITEAIKSYSVKPILLAANEADSLTKIKKKGFLPIEQWVCMYHEEKIEKKNSDAYFSALAISLLVNDSDLEEWINLVSESLFNNKDLDKSIFKFLKKNDVELVVAKLENKIIGTAMIYYDENNIAGIYMVCVSNKYRKQGIGKQIINFCFERIQLRNISYCILQATKQAILLYGSLGFKKTGTYNLYMKVK